MKSLRERKQRRKIAGGKQNSRKHLYLKQREENEANKRKQNK